MQILLVKLIHTLAPSASLAPTTNSHAIHRETSAYGSLDSSTTYIANRDLHRVPDCYWTHLSPEAMRIYEKMYEACKRDDGKVDCKLWTWLNGKAADEDVDQTFAGQFNNRNPRPDLVADCWTRLGSQSDLLDKHHTLAVTYMIHLESMMHKESLPQEFGRAHISDRRRKIISNFGKWVNCHCRQCGRKWSYANSQNGMQRDVNSSRPCVVDQWMNARRLLKWRYPRGAEFEKDNRNEWFGRSSR